MALTNNMIWNSIRFFFLEKRNECIIVGSISGIIGIIIIIGGLYYLNLNHHKF